MPTYQISEGIANGHRAPAGLFEILFLDAALTSGDANGATLGNETAVLTITGNALVYGAGAEGVNLLSGTLDSFTYTYRPGYYLTFTDLNLDVATLAAAARAEAGDNPGAMEALLYSLDWTVIDNSTAAGVNDTVTSYDGIPISFSGNDTVTLNYGHDTFHLGAGHDVAFGGQGDDTIHGGRGKDLINGNAGADSLFGDEGRDILNGGRGYDRIDGGKGNDVLRGGLGDDVLTGGANADRFLFRLPALFREYDQVTDFEVGIDRLIIRTDQTVTMQDFGQFLRIVVGDSVILLNGINEADLAPDSVAILPL